MHGLTHFKHEIVCKVGKEVYRPHAAVVKSYPYVYGTDAPADVLYLYGAVSFAKLVLYLQENLPDCRIFLCNINPISPDACRRHPQYEYAGQYNQAIMELCEELGVTYVDNTTLVLGHPELWDTDGIHPVQDVYLWMLSHMCYEAGI